MKKWDHLLESETSIQSLKRKASLSREPKDWDNYESALVRDRKLSRRINDLASGASLAEIHKLRRLIEKVQGMEGNQVVMATGLMGEPSERHTWLVLSLSGNTLRVRRSMPAGMGQWRWTSPRAFPKDGVSETRFYVVEMEPHQLPDDYVA